MDSGVSSLELCSLRVSIRAITERCLPLSKARRATASSSEVQSVDDMGLKGKKSCEKRGWLELSEQINQFEVQAGRTKEPLDCRDARDDSQNGNKRGATQKDEVSGF